MPSFTEDAVLMHACEGLGAMDMLAMHDRVHEVGTYYQAHLATNLRAFGIEVVLDDKTEAAKLTAIPDTASGAATDADDAER